VYADPAAKAVYVAAATQLGRQPFRLAVSDFLQGRTRVILATAPSGKSMSALVGGLEANGTLLVVGVPMDPIEVPAMQLVFGKRRIQGWLAGIPTDSEDTLRFAEMTGVRPMIEKYPLAKAAEGYARMMSGKAEFRVVLTM